MNYTPQLTIVHFSFFLKGLRHTKLQPFISSLSYLLHPLCWLNNSIKIQVDCSVAKMSCNGCRALRRGCSEGCILRPCLVWISNPKAQANATLFVSKFFGRTDLMAFISAVPQDKRPALFQSLLYEACGRTVNPVNGALGLLSTGNWHVCQEAVEIVLAGGVLRPITTGHGGGGWKVNPYDDQAIHEMEPTSDGLISTAPPKKSSFAAASCSSSDDVACDFEGTNKCFGNSRVGALEPKLLNLF